MTSKLTRERIEQYANDPRMCNINDEIRELARMALAAMDSEPVAYMVRRHNEHDGTGALIHAEFLGRYQERGDFHYTPLYRHAQPAPVVPEEAYSDDCPELYPSQPDAWAAGWNSCRATILRAGNHSGDINEMAHAALTNEGTIQAVNSPVIRDGYVLVPKEPTKEILDEFDSIIDYGAEDSVDAWSRLLAAAPQESINALIPLVSRNEQEVK